MGVSKNSSKPSSSLQPRIDVTFSVYVNPAPAAGPGRKLESLR